MINIKLELKNLIEKTMIPESKDFIEELNDLINNNKATKDDVEAKKEMLVFLSELETILSAINKDDITDEEAADIYEKIIHMLEYHSED
ncbi:hypothetical protein AAX26_01625 [Aliarcobacter thereius]|uniref:DNA repair protein Rad50 n=2 Tax=Aliarcobacter thereius TaxID=544718 RepID=A0A1C0B5Q8_9BACT|nr:hypothetical protein [Aliarcobacter thereius]OCL85976.1 hypothetical protein AAX26_01625 [Aliarcobacter thereius]OCL90481.1 hypothetical protein AAX25_01574 [Aliarcobacter thereius]OCL95724.1 hypothetical protein AA347_01204 [Aliarcobacter thereius LMG 24486]OCL98368.1 hypothetical protein AAX29_01605 [Aliarcobacter thereius]QBF16293.1 hypothetical protein ATH_1244 [Aliarcobacter thereius LMG 24486]